MNVKNGDFFAVLRRRSTFIVTNVRDKKFYMRVKGVGRCAWGSSCKLKLKANNPRFISTFFETDFNETRAPILPIFESCMCGCARSQRGLETVASQTGNQSRLRRRGKARLGVCSNQTKPNSGTQPKSKSSAVWRAGKLQIVTLTGISLSLVRF